MVAAAVILDPTRPIAGLADSKTLSATRREQLAVEIRANALAWALGCAEAAEIDQINILQATLLAMERAVSNLGITPDSALVDGNRCPALTCPCQAIIKGDATCFSAISVQIGQNGRGFTASMYERYPQYGFARHKGLPWVHRCPPRGSAPLRPCPEHRRPFVLVGAAR